MRATTMYVRAKMRIFPKCAYLNISMISGSLLGIIPWQFVFEEHKLLQKIYYFYSNFMLGYYTLFLVAAYIKLYQILTAADGLKLDDIASNIPVTLFSSITFIRQFVIKFSRSFKGIVKQIIKSENDIIAMNDKDIFKIYEKSTQNMKIKSKWYLAMMFVCTFQYNVVPVLMGPEEQRVGNVTVLIKPLPMSLWFPADDQKYYLIAYLRQILDGTMEISFLAYTDVLMFSLIVFPIGQLQILNYMLEHFETYKQKYLNSDGIADDEMAAFTMFVVNIRKHQEIIEYVQHFNKTMSNLMVLEFLQFSLEIASICLQAVANEITPLLVFFVIFLVFTLLLRLFLYYYYANEIIILSHNLSNSICKSNWYDQPPRVKFLMQIFMMRSQKLLSYTIGPFSDMSLNSMIAILKATYSYVMLIYNTNY